MTTPTPELVELADRLLGRKDARTASPSKIDALFAFEEGRTLFRPTIYMRHKEYAWLRDSHLIEGDTDSCLLTPLGKRLQEALRARASQDNTRG
jgi:hypothetical protein